MKGFVSLGLLGSRLGREIYALAGLVAAVPIVVFATIGVIEIEHAFHARTERALGADAREFAEVVSERLDYVADILGQIGRGETLATQLTGRYLSGYAVLDSSGAKSKGGLELPSSVLEAARGLDETRIVSDAGDSAFGLYMLEPVGAHVAVGYLSPDFVLKPLDTLSSSIALCVIAEGLWEPVYCSNDMPEDAATRIAYNLHDQETLRWDSPDDSYLAMSAPLAAASQSQSPALSVVAVQPSSAAMSDLAALRQIYRPILLGMFIFTLLASGIYAKRILNPLAKMLDMTKLIAAGEFSTKAKFGQRNELSDLANGLQTMAADIEQKFNALRTLSGIDKAILSGMDMSRIVDLTLLHITDSLPCRRATVTILNGTPEGNAVAATISRGHPVTRSSENPIEPENRQWLEDHRDGLLVSFPNKKKPYGPFVAFDVRHTFVLPVVANGEAAGALSISMQDELALDDIHKSHAKDLADRLAVALEAVSKSAELHRKAYFDDLTGLPNRDFCFDRLDHALKQAKHLESAVAVMFIDLDGFKAVNDSLGHIAGDELIRQAGYRLAACVSELGTIGRLGGDEFAVVLPFPVNDAAPDHIAERVLTEIKKPFVIGNSELHLSASIGVARYPEDGVTRGELLRRADTAMYRAKETGRGRSVDYSETMGLQVDKRMKLEADLRHALENDELQIYYQPQIDMRTGRIISAEALVRWFHPERGLLPPVEFVPIAEDSGYIAVLDAWIMSNACRQLARWQDEGLGIERVAVNVSAGQFRRPSFVEEVASAMIHLHSATRALEIELTESVFVEDLKQARQTLELLKSTGVSISIDDFGTGYSSLGYLKHLTFDVVKIDQAFVHGLPTDKKSEAIVRAVLAMCHTLDKQVVAEGIETVQQLKYLREAGVDIGQGFYIGKPMAAEQFEDCARRYRAAPPGRTLQAGAAFR